MAVQEAIKRLRYVFSSEGADKVAQDLGKVAQGQAHVAATAQTSERASLSLDRQFGSLERRYNSTLRAQQDYEKVQRQVNAAVAQNPALQGRANDILRQAADHYGKATTAQALWSRGMQAANDNAQMFAARAGAVGSALAGLGPAGLAAAAGIVVATLGMHKLVQEVNALADRGGKMVDFAETTGLTTTQLQALQKAAAGVGIDSEKVGTGFERFTVQLEQLRRGSGDLFEALNRIDPALTDQLAATRDAGQAWDLFARGVAKADRELANVASKAAFGRTGIPFTRLAGANNEAGGLAGLEQGLGRVNVLTAEQLRRWDELKDQIDITAKTARDNIVSIFADDVLQAQLKFYQMMLGISQAAKKFSLSPELRSFLDKSGTIWRILQRGGRGGSDSAGAGAGAATIGPFPPAPANFNERFGAFSGNVTTKPEFDAARLRQRIDVLGSAASATMRLALAEAELAIRAKAAGVSQEDLARGISALRLESVIAQEQRRIALLGDLASVDAIVLAKQLEINQARMSGIRITQDEAAAILERTRIQADAARVESQLAFERAQALRSPTDARVAETLRGQGIAPESARGQNVAEMIRFNEQLKLSIDLSTEFATGFARDLRQTGDVLGALTNALNRLADRLIDMAVNRLVQQALGGLVGSIGNTGNAAFSGITGMGGAPFASNHTGGVVGESSGTRYVNPGVFAGAPRMHAGGIAGLRADEVPTILQRGERVIPRGGASGGDQIVNVYNYSDNTDVETKKRNEGGATITDVIISTVNREAAGGGLDASMGGRFGARPRRVKR